MNKLLKLAVISLFGFNGCTMHDETREESNHLKQTFNSLCVENNEDTTAKIAFDFGNGIITESQHFKFKVTTDYQSKPEIIVSCPNDILFGCVVKKKNFQKFLIIVKQIICIQSEIHSLTSIHLSQFYIF